MRAALAAGHWRVHKLQAQVARCSAEFARDGGRGRGVVHKHGAFAHAGKSAVGAQGDAAQIVVIADATKHDVSLRRRFTRGAGMVMGPAHTGGSAKLGHPGLGLGAAAVVDGDAVTGARQVASHGVAHDAQAQKGHGLGRCGLVRLGVDGR